jgi:biotin carboxyl carrier protein
MKYQASIGSYTFEVEIEERGTVLMDGEPLAVDLQEIVPGRLYSLLLDNVSTEAYVEHQQDCVFQVLSRGKMYHVKVQDERAIRLATGMAGFVPDSGEIDIQAPMPGLIVNVPVVAGQKVTAGEVLVVLESMKMDNELTAPRDGIVARLHVEIGDSVDGKQTLVTLA